MKQSHLFDPKHIAVLESEDRRMWQSPDVILSAAEVKPNFVVADLGCGSGYFTVPLAAKAKKVYGIDVQKEMIDFVREKIRRLKIKNVELLVSKPAEIPLENESIDLLLTVNTLHEFDDRERMIEEMKRVVKKGGKLLIVDFMKKETGFGPPVEIRMSKAKAVKFFEAKGFTLVEKRDLSYHYLLVFVKS
jgi:ubiquinone/menaquinone biosynthesis C-methylase UbiE